MKPVFRSDDLAPLRDVIAAHGLHAQKSLGQNFLLDQNVTDKIVRFAGSLDQANVFEIGPGPGGLTRSLLKSNAKKIIAVEFDERAVRALEELRAASNGRLEIIQGDALSVLKIMPDKSIDCVVINNKVLAYRENLYQLCKKGGDKKSGLDKSNP